MYAWMREPPKRTKESFYMMPEAIAKRTDMSSTAKLVFTYLLYVMWGKGVCWTGLRTIQEAVGVSVNTVRKKLAELMRLELLTVEPGSRGQITTFRIPHSVPPCYTLCDSEVYQKTQQVYQSGISSVLPGDTEVYPRVIPKQNRLRKQKKQKGEPDSWESVEKILQSDSPLKTHRFQERWEAWAKFRRTELHKKLTPTMVKGQIRKCVKWGLEDALLSLERSMDAGWAGLFEPRKESKHGSKNPATVVAEPGKYDKVPFTRSGAG